MSKQGKKEAAKLLKEILDISYPLCKHANAEVANQSASINSKAYEILKLIEHRELE